jgi:peptidoglycan hydrolase-like protein with peptidoglycan-binding domain
LRNRVLTLSNLTEHQPLLVERKDDPYMSISKRLGLVTAMAVSVSLAGYASGNAQNAAPPAASPAAVAPAQPAPPPHAKPMSSRQHNASVQAALNSNGAHLKVDGRMGPKTRVALRSFQHKHHLKPTGRADSATLKALGLQG